MADRSKIEWTDATWNPITGCDKISAGCRNCYAMRLARRLQAMGSSRYANGEKVTLHWDALDIPLHWREPRCVFINSMSDLFHESVPLGFIERVLDTARRAPRHTFQVLTKRSERLRQLSSRLDWPDNVWVGVTVESGLYAYRVEHLREVAARVRFLSVEPLIGSVAGLDLSGIDWVIAGGESGPGARPMEESWVRGLRDQCVASGVAFFFKQWGGVHRAGKGRLLDGRTWDQMPPLASPSRPQVAGGTSDVCP